MPETNAIVDLSHFNQNVDFQRAKGDGIVGVVHKATQGISFADPVYASHRGQAVAAGLLWGAYHFGTCGDGVQQADFFLKNVGASAGVLMALDLEVNPQGPSMTLDQARAFVTQVQSVTGIWPGIYGGWYLKELLGTHHDPVLGNCWLWLSEYGPAAVIPPNWKSWTLWQYTDGVDGAEPHMVAGIGRCDRDKFNGDTDELVRFWNS